MVKNMKPGFETAFFSEQDAIILYQIKDYETLKNFAQSRLDEKRGRARPENIRKLEQILENNHSYNKLMFALSSLFLASDGNKVVGQKY
jgi:hypothetical protein